MNVPFMLNFRNMCFVSLQKLVFSEQGRIDSLRTAEVSPRSSPLREPPREKWSLSGDERGETSAVRRLEDPGIFDWGSKLWFIKDC